jgi:hypothetical protein
MSRRTKPTGKLALIVMAAFLGVGVLSILATGLFRLSEGAIFIGLSWVSLGLFAAYGGAKFLRDQWPD